MALCSRPYHERKYILTGAGKSVILNTIVIGDSPWQGFRSGSGLSRRSFARVPYIFPMCFLFGWGKAVCGPLRVLAGQARPPFKRMWRIGCIGGDRDLA